MRTECSHRSKNASEHFPLVSVIAPIYNVERYLDQCLSSIRSQIHQNLEIICLNDGSTDNSLEIIQKHAAEDDRIIIVDKKNEGYGASCNRGISLAKGEWIAIVEPDDWIESGMYADMLAFERSTGAPCDIVKTPYWRIIAADTPDQRKVNCSYRRRINPARQPFTLAEAPRLIRHHPSIWSALYRASFLKENDIRFHEIPGAGWADNPFMADTLLRAERIAYLDTPYYCYREETPEQEEASIKRNPLLPIDRWNDVEDVVEELEVHDQRVVEEIYHRGLNNLELVISHVGRTDEVVAAAKSALARMESDLVFESSAISPSCKRLYADILGIECPPIDELQWKKKLIGELIYTLRNTGLRHTLQAVKQRL